MTAPLDPLDGAFFDLSARTKIRVSGNDRLRFLNGQVTNDVGKATHSSAIAACVLNAKGRMNAHVFVSAEPDCFLLDADSELRETLQARLERYVIADDVQIEDLSDNWAIFHLLRPPPPGLSENCKIVSATRFPKAGWDLWIGSSQHDTVFQQLLGALPFCDDACTEVFRIEQGIPRCDRELTEEIIPIEAGLEESCVDYEKGCYIGQEVISRMKMSGQRNKKLCGFVSLHNSPLGAGMKLFLMGEEKKEVGWITSATHSERLGKEIALGYLKRPFYRTGGELDALDSNNLFGSPAARVKIVDLPFMRGGNRN
jgi:folate-binding protein YgfZ